MDVVAIEIGLDSWRLVRLRGSLARRAKSEYMDFTGEPSGRASSILSYISENGLTDAKLAVVLPRELSFSRVLSIPAPNASVLDRIISFEIEKHLPFAPSEAYYGYQVIERKGPAYTVLIGAAAKNKVDDIIESLLSAGLKPSMLFFWHGAVINSLDRIGRSGKEKLIALIGVEREKTTIDFFQGLLPVYSKSIVFGDFGSETAQIIRFELYRAATILGLDFKALKIIFTAHVAVKFALCLPEGMGENNILKLDKDLEAGGLAAYGGAMAVMGSAICRINMLKAENKGLAQYKTSVVLVMSALLLFVLTGASYVASDMLTLKRLDRSIEDLKIQKNHAMKNSGLVLSAGQNIKKLEAISSSPSLVLDILKDLTTILPEDSWLTYLDCRDGLVIIEGISGDAPALLIKLENSMLMSDFEFVSPVVAVSGGREKFRIKSSIRPKEGDI